MPTSPGSAAARLALALQNALAQRLESAIQSDPHLSAIARAARAAFPELGDAAEDLGRALPLAAADVVDGARAEIAGELAELDAGLARALRKAFAGKRRRAPKAPKRLTR